MWSYGKSHVIMVWLSILGGVCNRISARERGNMSRTTDRAGRNKGQWIVIGFMAFAIIVISICTVIFRSYVRGFHKVTDREIYDRYYVMITEDRNRISGSPYTAELLNADRKRMYMWICWASICLRSIRGQSLCGSPCPPV